MTDVVDGIKKLVILRCADRRVSKDALS